MRCASDGQIEKRQRSELLKMVMDQSAEILRLRGTVRDLLALSIIPEAWVAREPPAIAADLADLLIGSLKLDFAFVRLCDPTGNQAVEVIRGNCWKGFPEWLQQRFARFGQVSRTEIVTNVGGVEKSCRGVVIPIGVNSERGLIAAACDRSDFPDQIDQQLLSVAANSSRPEFLEFLQNVGRRSFLGSIATFLLVAGQACRRAVQPVPEITLVLIDQTWLDRTFQDRRNLELEQFTKETGIRVKLLPSPEGAVETLDAWRSLLESGAKIPDVYAVDVIWPGILAENLLDLKAFVPAQEIASHFPELIANNTVNGRLVALPCLVDVGLLFYRTDLLRHYGYRTPPRTWDELETMAARIQAGERARGQKDFCGFVWEGSSSETLTCNALEWQVSEGGGPIVENNMVTVNNPETRRALERAARWVGTISPPAVVTYKGWDAYNIWQAGQAAFMRNWATSPWISSPKFTMDQFDIASLPRGTARIATTVGGRAYAVSRHSLHPREAAMLVRFLCRPDIQLNRLRNIGGAPTIPELYNDPGMLATNPYFSTVLKTYRNDKVWRPSKETGKRYPALSRAYFMAAHEVLAGKKTAATALSDLQAELMQITGLNAPAPGTSSGPHGTSAILRMPPCCTDHTVS